jgi:hypothetical protein
MEKIVPSPILIAAVVAGYFQPNDWIELSDKTMEQLEKVPFWLADLSVTKSKQEAVAILWQAHVSTKGGIDFNSLIVGFTYLLYHKKSMSFSELLYKLGAYTDGVNYKTDCSFFYMLLNKLEGRFDEQKKTEEELLPDLVAGIQEEIDLVKTQLRSFSMYEMVET